MDTSVYVFRVYDSDGLWGYLRIRGSTEDNAQRSASRWLEDNEVAPNGSLNPDFALVVECR